MPTRASLPALLAVIELTGAVAGCHSRERQSETARAPGVVGFELPDSASVARGALLCLAARAAASGLSGLPPGTRVTVQLALRTP
jgi:hypothetical protein